ncbi:MAG: DUF1800 domain-containing protein [Ignavibacteriae bacterium]|nr:DUF1800 domain-containing protein [Ignavibacteriota bacterium]
MKRRDLFTLKTNKPIEEIAPKQDLYPNHLSRTTAGLEPYIPSTDQPWDYSRAAHLLRRTMIGPKDIEIREVFSLGLDKTLERLFQPATISTKEIEPWCFAEPQIRAVPAGSGIPGLSDPEFPSQNILRREILTRWYAKTIAVSGMNLQERMVMFWTGILTSEIDVVQVSEWMFNQQTLLRKHCLGNFKTLINEITIDPGMLVYLDGIRNQKTANTTQINENYARELMELFTCGPTDWEDKPNYSEDDVREAARALSGWTIAPSTNPNASARPYYLGTKGNFISFRWDSGKKTFLGETGNWKATDIINILFQKRSTQIARFICEKLYRAFVYDIPDRNIIDQMAVIFMKDWEIKPVLNILLNSAHFFDSENIGAMYKSPVSFLIGSIRSMGISQIPDFRFETSSNTNRDLTNRLGSLGEILFNPPNVKGWPGGRTWVSTSTVSLRQKFILDVIDGKIMLRDNGKQTRFYIFSALDFAKSSKAKNASRIYFACLSFNPCINCIDYSERVS